jgi:cob(I)alamin adenosyltransferase
MRTARPASRAPFQGQIQVYTGNGKGKTTAALGLALRAAGSGFRTYIGQFCKGQKYGELESIKRLAPLVTIEQFGRKTFIHIKVPADPADVRMARRGLARSRAAMLSGRYDIIVLDEILIALFFHLLTEADVLTLMAERPPAVELILTGRYAPAAIVRRAGLVTEMKERKHYYAKGIEARVGIEK